MEEKFKNMSEELARFQALRMEADALCKAECNEIQRQADERKCEAIRKKSQTLIEIACKQDVFLNDYRQWKRENEEQPAE